MAPGTAAPAPEVLDSLEAVSTTMQKLLRSTLRHEMLVAQRDLEIARIQKDRSPAIDKAAGEAATFTSQLDQYCRAHPESLEPGKKSVQFTAGLMGLRAASNPALIPLSEKWTWEAIALKVKELWKKKYFHAPKPPGLDKVKLKKALDEKQLAKCGLKLDTAETFYVELNRLAAPAEQSEAAA